MTRAAGATTLLLDHGDTEPAIRFTESASTLHNPALPTEQVPAWLAARLAANDFEISKIPFSALDRWGFEAGTGNLRHASGRFFTVEGLRVRTDYGTVPEWSQPIVNQPEIGILGILVKEIDGVLHCLMSAKMEPGNVNLVQLSPTVQATRSNYTRAHQGAETPFLGYFLGSGRGKVLVDVLQSEQGSWFYRKCNRNMVVEVSEDFEAGPEFCWLTIGQVLAMMRHDNLVNMDARTVLSCIPFAEPRSSTEDSEFDAALIGSVAGRGTRHHVGDLLSWFTDSKTRYSLQADRVPLAGLDGWHWTDTTISHDEGKHFDIIAVSVGATNREVASWTQPLIEPTERGEIAMLVKRIDGVLHALLHIRVEPGYQSAVELAPTVQCHASYHLAAPPELRPPYFDVVMGADPASVRYDAVQSEEGGRFYHAQNRYRVIEVGEDFAVEEPPDFRWMSVRQVRELLRHSHYLNVQARSIVTSLHSLWAGER